MFACCVGGEEFLREIRIWGFFLLALCLPYAILLLEGIGPPYRACALGTGLAWVRLRARMLLAAVIGTTCVLGAGLWIGTDGVAFGLPRMDWFHLVLGLGVLSLGWGPTLAPAHATAGAG